MRPKGEIFSDNESPQLPILAGKKSEYGVCLSQTLPNLDRPDSVRAASSNGLDA